MSSTITALAANPPPAHPNGCPLDGANHQIKSMLEITQSGFEKLLMLAVVKEAQDLPNQISTSIPSTLDVGDTTKLGLSHLKAKSSDIQLGQPSISCAKNECTAVLPVKQFKINGQIDLFVDPKRPPILHASNGAIEINGDPKKPTETAIVVKAKLTGNLQRPFEILASSSTIRLGPNALSVFSSASPPGTSPDPSRMNISSLFTAEFSKYLSEQVMDAVGDSVTSEVNAATTDLPLLHQDVATQLEIPAIQDRVTDLSSLQTLNQTQDLKAKSYLERLADAKNYANFKELQGRGVPSPDEITQYLKPYTGIKNPQAGQLLSDVFAKWLTAAQSLEHLPASRVAAAGVSDIVFAEKQKVARLLEQMGPVVSAIKQSIAADQDQLLLRVVAMQSASLPDSIQMLLSVCLPCRQLQTNDPMALHDFTRGAPGDERKYDAAAKVDYTALNNVLQLMWSEKNKTTGAGKFDLCIDTTDSTISCENAPPRDSLTSVKFLQPPKIGWDPNAKRGQGSLYIDAPSVEFKTKNGELDNWGVATANIRVYSDVSAVNVGGESKLQIAIGDIQTNAKISGEGIKSWLANQVGDVSASITEKIRSSLTTQTIGLPSAISFQSVIADRDGVRAYATINDAGTLIPIGNLK